MPPGKVPLRIRKAAKTRPLRRILILCEDTKSSRDYLAAFPHDKELVEIECIGTGRNTDGLMENAIERASDARSRGRPYERVWVVFDKDDWSMQNFNRAFDLARSWNEVVACWSNECFEIWYLLHFHYRDTPIARHEIGRLLAKQTGRKYDKADADFHRLLQPHMQTALRHASRLAFENEQLNQARRNPSTGVHELVDALVKLNPARHRD